MMKITSPQIAILKRAMGHLADFHEVLTRENCPEASHRAIYECPCDVARDYRAVKCLHNAARSREEDVNDQ